MMEINSVNTYQPTKPVEPTPPPGGNIENRQPPSEPKKPTGVDYNTLQTLQNILGDYPGISDTNSDKKTEFNSKLSDAGLLEPGALLNTLA